MVLHLFIEEKKSIVFILSCTKKGDMSMFPFCFALSFSEEIKFTYLFGVDIVAILQKLVISTPKGVFFIQMVS